MRNLGRFRTRDSALAYYVNQLENLDKRLYEPLTSVSWGRDIKLRPGITMSNESTSFIRSAFAATGTLNQTGNMSWISPETTAIPGVSVNGEKVVLPLRLLAREISYTSVELERSQLTGQPIDTQKMDAMNTIYQMNTDQMVYIGATEVGATGLVNSALVTNVAAVANGISGTPEWTTKTPDEMLADVNELLESVWSASAFAVCPNKLLLPPAQFSYLASQKVSSAGNISILKFLRENCISLEAGVGELDIKPVKWLTDRGVGPSDRMVAYTNAEDRVRFPMVPVRRETAYYSGIRFTAPYLWAFGEMEIVYPETIGYRDGIQDLILAIGFVMKIFTKRPIVLDGAKLLPGAHVVDDKYEKNWYLLCQVTSGIVQIIEKPQDSEEIVVKKDESMNLEESLKPEDVKDVVKKGKTQKR